MKDNGKTQHVINKATDIFENLKKIIYILTFLLVASCEQQKSQRTTIFISDTTGTNNNSKDYDTLIIEGKKNLTDFLPKGFVIFQKITGDLNKDGLEDCVLIIKGTDKNQIISHEYHGQLDRNRRGIIVLFNKGGQFELAVTNYDCFSSENEDGGVYFPPELSVKIKNGNLFIHYAHGRYGYWKYNFRYQNSDFELIGYEASNGGAVTTSATSINFLSKKKQERVNTNENAKGGDEVFEETWEKINVSRLIKLSEIKDFDNFDMNLN